MTDWTFLARTKELAQAFLETLADRPVVERANLEALRAALGGQLPHDGIDGATVIEDLARDVEPGLVASAGPRYFGFVTGGCLPVTVAADWLVTAWDQNVGLYVESPALAVMEDTAGRWLLDLFSLPSTASVGFVTGCHMANFTALAAARHDVLQRAGWDVEADGLQGAPRVTVVVGNEVHVSVIVALRLLGFGSRHLIRVPVNGQGAMLADELARVLDRGQGPTIVCAQAGNVNTGAFDPIEQIATQTRPRGAWLHVDGAFGLWAAATPSLAHHVQGLDRADSWATDGHKWLNVPYDSGIVCVANPDAHRSAMSLTASYLVRGDEQKRDGMDWTPESSRRARVVPIYAALRTLGRSGVADLIERCCRLARRAAEGLARHHHVRILNDVVLNQVLVRFEAPDFDPDVLTRTVISRVQQDGTCWLGGTTWRNMAAMRVSVCNWSTGEDDIDRSVAAILGAFDRERAAAIA